MSKRARTATVAAHTGRTTVSVPRKEHEHVYTLVKTSGNRIRRGCVCGDWRKWQRMNAIEIAGYRPQVFAKRLAEATTKAAKPITEALHSTRKTFEDLGKTMKEYGLMPDQPTPKKDVRALLAQTHTEAVDDTAHEVDRITGEAGVTVQDDSTWYDDIVIDPRTFPETYGGLIDQYPTHGDVAGLLGQLPDRDAAHSLAVTEDFEPESEVDPNMYCAHGVHLDANDRSCCEYDPEQDKDMCYLILGSNPPVLMAREDAHQELDAYRKANPNGPHEIGDALWDDDMGEWKLPIDAGEHVDEAVLSDFVAESFGVDGDPDLVAAPAAPRFSLDLDFGNDTNGHFEHQDVAALANDLNTWKRDDLEFAARKFGIVGVTTKVRKELLIRALVVMADTSLVHEHALNRAAVMLRSAPKDSGTEWATHYAGTK